MADEYNIKSQVIKLTHIILYSNISLIKLHISVRQTYCIVYRCYFIENLLYRSETTLFLN